MATLATGPLSRKSPKVLLASLDLEGVGKVLPLKKGRVGGVIKGQPAPDIELRGSEGPWRLSDQQGHPVLLVFLRWLG